VNTSYRGRWIGLSRYSSLLPLYSPEDGSRVSFRNVVILIFNILLFGRWIKSINPSPHRASQFEDPAYICHFETCAVLQHLARRPVEVVCCKVAQPGFVFDKLFLLHVVPLIFVLFLNTSGASQMRQGQLTVSSVVFSQPWTLRSAVFTIYKTNFKIQ
jgi:hypothetical protein